MKPIEYTLDPDLSNFDAYTEESVEQHPLALLSSAERQEFLSLNEVLGRNVV